MDITLERILSLIPRKEDGKFKHGELSKFARKLGFKDGHIVSDWLAGNSASYLNYLYQISVIYGVSVEWLQGKTDDPAPVGQKEGSPQIGELTEDELRLLTAYRAAPEKKRANILGLLEN